jgi:transposase InsO family protein
MADLVVSMDVRMAIVFVCCSPEPVNVTAFCAEHGISRETFYVYRRRFAAGGVQGVLPLSRRPMSSPTRTDQEVIEAVLAAHDRLRGEGWDAGARSVRDRLLADGTAGVPSDRTVHRILAMHERVKPSPRKRRRDSFRRFESSTPNGMWQLDGTQVTLADDTAVHVLRVQDDHSRMLLATLAAPAEDSAAAIEVLTTAMSRHGRPAALLHDGAMAYSGRRRGRDQVTEVQWWLARLGVHQIVSSPYHPQTCGKKEREWQGLHRWLDAHPTAASIAELQRLLDTYDAVFNHERTHQGIGRVTPAARYTAGDKAGPAADTPLPTVTFHHDVIAGAHGDIPLGSNHSIRLGHQWTGAHLTVLRHDLDVVVFDGTDIIRQLRIDPTRRRQPSGLKPGRPRKQPVPSEPT